jgi:hypothetical protein
VIDEVKATTDAPCVVEISLTGSVDVRASGDVKLVFLNVGMDSSERNTTEIRVRADIGP